ncbi:MAG: hypothetical protein U1C51_09645, partial [Candidatus Izemoplasmatales bacterium]|nr:hypothetical protein [Candidatus Izemoplasmatales bacterium]
MEYVTLAISALALIVSIVILIFIIKNEKIGDLSLGDNELKKIRESINEVVSNLSSPISSLIAEKNSSLMDNLNKRVDDLNKKIDDLVKSQDDLKQNQTKFKEDGIKVLVDNHEKISRLITDFTKQYTEDS